MENKRIWNQVYYIRMVDAGKNLTLQERSDNSNWKLGINFEYTVRNTLQQNHLTEQGFAHLANLCITKNQQHQQLHRSVRVRGT
jgi:hypothetical protein